MRKFTFSENLSMAVQYLTRYRAIERFTNQRLEEIRAHQFKTIKALLDLAYDHTSFYRRKYSDAGIHPSDIHTWQDFERIPTLTKDEVFEHAREMIVDNVHIEDLILSRSSGSTGRFINIYLDGQNFIEQELQVIRMLKSFYPAYQPRDKELLIYTSEYPFNSIFGQYSVEYIHNLAPVHKMFEAIVRHKPVIVAAYPSILREIVREYGERCKMLGIKVILTNSEHSSQAERDSLGEEFGCAVYDEYSSEELSSIAWQCVNKNYHMVPDSSYIEILDPSRDVSLPNGTAGEVVGTCLINRSMPFIRYRQADIAIMSSETCTCGNHARILKEMSGRKNSSFQSSVHGEISSGRVLDWTYNLVLNDQLDIQEFQVRQKTVADIVVTLVSGSSYDASHDNARIIQSFQQTFGEQFNVAVKLVPRINKTRAGKHIPIVSQVAAPKNR
jgi:phenylacetate-CoA ligase